MPPYFPQKHPYACSLAVLRSVLAAKGLTISEGRLLEKVEQDYGKRFKNLWNPTVAKIACEYCIPTKMYALWPLFKSQKLGRALKEFKTDPDHMDVREYENTKDKDHISEPLPLAYKEMFKAIEHGCQVIYGGLTRARIERILGKGYYIQTSIKTKLLYPGERASFHSILLYSYRDGQVTYHDPARRAAMKSSVDKLLKAANGTGAFIVYEF